jgi:hypothetical protein
MKRTANIGATVAAFVIAISTITPASASPRTWVSSTGSGSTCTRTLPCGSFATALSVTDSGGVISCADTFEYLLQNTTFTISKSVTLDCGGSLGAIGKLSGSGINISGSGIAVTLRNIAFQGYSDGLGDGASVGVNFIDGAALIIENCSFSGFKYQSGIGILFTPSSPAKLYISDSVIENNGLASSAGGIIIKPSGSGSVQAVLERVEVKNNTFGIAVDGTGSTAGINMTIADSLIAGNVKDGIIATTPSGGAPIGVLVTGTKSVNNAVGIRSIGANVTVRVDSSKIAGNGAGLSFSSAGALLTFGNNAVRANASDGAFSGSVVLQ